VLTGIAQCLKWIVLSLVFSILIEWVGMVFWWEEQGLAHSRQMLVNELQFLGADFHRSWLTEHPMQFTSDLSDRFYYFAFEWTGIVDLIQWITPPPILEEPGVRPVLHALYRPVADFVLAGMQITQVFAVRLAILTLATPVFGLFTLVALVDGLVRRDLRRWGGGRESSFVYHYAKKAALPLIVTAWVLYLALPVSLHPSWIILPFALVFGFAVTITASTFKKYL
jgi:integrating conjugative element membrane protein (TIGR03747 family)